MTDSEKMTLRLDSKTLSDISYLVEREFGRSALASVLQSISNDILEVLNKAE